MDGFFVFVLMVFCFILWPLSDWLRAMLDRYRAETVKTATERCPACDMPSGKDYTSHVVGCPNQAVLSAAPDKTEKQLVSTQKALRGLYNAVQKSRSVNDPIGVDLAMEEAGKWF